MTQDEERGQIGAWGIGLFLGLFVVAGLGALCMGFVELARNGTDEKGLIALFGVGVSFTLVPGALLLGLISAMEKAKDMARRQGEFPDEPWRWRAEWDKGTVASVLPPFFYFQWLFGLVFSAAGALLAYNWEDVMKGGQSGYIFLLVPIFGVLCLLPAVYATLRRWKWRDTICELQTNPGAIGGRFLATIRTKVSPAQFDSIEQRLTCFYYNPNNGTDTGHGTRTELWREEQTIPWASVGADPQGAALVPVNFAIPATCQPTTPELTSNRVQWELAVSAKASGINLSANYIVPIFPFPGVQAIPCVESPAPEMPIAGPQTILIKECDDEIEFRYIGSSSRVLFAFVFSIYLIVHMTTTAYLVSTARMPLFIGIIFGGFGLPLLFATAWLWFGKRFIHLNPSSITEVSTLFGIRRRRAIPLRDIVVDAQVAGCAGKTLYYAIRIHTSAGLRTVLSGIRDKAEADGIVRLIEEYVLRHGSGAN